MRRFLVVALSIGLLGGAVVGPADAKRKKKPKPPVTFDASGSLSLSNPGDLMAQASVTRQEFVTNCAIPASQGVDGYVIELPPEVSAITANVRVNATATTGLYDLDLYYFSESCAPMGENSTPEPNEFGEMPVGTKYVLVNAFWGAGMEFRFEAEEKRN